MRVRWWPPAKACGSAVKESRPSRAFFAGLAVFLSFVVLFTIAYKFSIAEMWIIWIGTYLFIRYGTQKIFHNFARHRGIFHSLLAATAIRSRAASIASRECVTLASLYH